MKRRYLALSLCIVFFALEFAVFVPVSEAKKEDLVTALLGLPAPPPPNPLVRPSRAFNDPFFDKTKPPADNAPIEDLIEYWSRQSTSNTGLNYRIEPSEHVTSRLLAEIRKDHLLLSRLLGALPYSKDSIEVVKDIYDLRGDLSSGPVKKWLTYHSPYFSETLELRASRVADVRESVSNQNELIALTTVDFERAKPIIDRLYLNGSQRVSQVLAIWALYKRALETGSTGDIERYRDELKAVVEDKTATAGMRDLAIDALSQERDFPGRDEWYYSLLGDETLADLRVNGTTYTGLTTLIYYSPDEKYIEKMIEFTKSENKVIRTAAVKNLALKFNTPRPDVIRALTPWLSDKNWSTAPQDIRFRIVMSLSQVSVPESVPGLIKMLDEQVAVGEDSAVRPAMPVAATPATRPAANAPKDVKASVTAPAMTTAFRYAAIRALAKQKSPLAGAPLRRILDQSRSVEIWQLVGPTQLCGGFSLAEQMAALDEIAGNVKTIMAAEDADASELNATGAAKPAMRAVPAVTVHGIEPVKYDKIATAAEIRSSLGEFLTSSGEITDELARAVIDRIESLDKSDPARANAYRRLVLRWPNKVVNAMLLRDLKNDRSSAESVIRLLATRNELRETNGAEITDAAAGNGTARGIAACIDESAGDYITILESEEAAAKAALFACGRMIRAKLPLDRTIPLLKSENKLLAKAAESYLESEDSPAARAAVLALHPNEARIMGATTAFLADGKDFIITDMRSWLPKLFLSTGSSSGNLYALHIYGSQSAIPIKVAEKAIQEELKKDESLLGVYSYADNYVRIYRDRVIYSWNEDDARYRERPLRSAEFDQLKTYLKEQNADELPPFLNCQYGGCAPTELLMLGRAGGRRIYTAGDASPFFTGLKQYFDELKKEPATLRYVLSREVPGLEIVFADDRYHAATVWKDGGDLRVAVVDEEIVDRVETEVD